MSRTSTAKTHPTAWRLIASVVATAAAIAVRGRAVVVAEEEADAAEDAGADTTEGAAAVTADMVAMAAGASKLPLKR